MGGVKTKHYAWAVQCRVREGNSWGEPWVIGEGAPRYLSFTTYARRADARRRASELRGPIDLTARMYAKAVKVRVTTDVVG